MLGLYSRMGGAIIRGLGVDYDWDFIERNRTAPLVDT